MNNTAKSFRDGTHRTLSPARTLDVVAPHLPAMGITRVANVTGLDRIGVPVVNAYRPNSRSLSVSQGKGLNLAAAKASAVMEAIEGFHAEVIDLPLRDGTFREISAQCTVADLQGLPHLSGTAFRDDRPLLWIEGQNLLSGDALWLPFELVHTDYTLPRLPNAGCFVASTNGLASGNHALEAVVHGICEVIERDAHTLWELTPFQSKVATRMDLDSVTDDKCRAILKALQDAGISVGVWDMTSDVGVATFHCLITDDRQKNGHSGGGAGTHLSRDVALLRALTEAVQVRTNYITGARDDLRHGEYEVAGIEQKNRFAQDLMKAPLQDLRAVDDVPTYLFDTLEEDLTCVLDRLQQVGIKEVIDLDLTKPEFDIPVHRVVIPGLEGPHDHDDYCPGDRAHALLDRMTR